MNYKKKFTIYSQRLAGYLMQNGVPMLKLVVNDYTGMNNFLFEDTPRLHELMTLWQMENVNRKNRRIVESGFDVSPLM